MEQHTSRTEGDGSTNADFRKAMVSKVIAVKSPSCLTINLEIIRDSKLMGKVSSEEASAGPRVLIP
jgi:hypothetical protein